MSGATKTAPRPQPGELAPFFVCAAEHTGSFHFSSLGGRWIVLAFLGSLADAAGREIQRAIAQNRALFDDIDAQFFGVTTDEADVRARGLQNAMPGLRYFWDFDKNVSTLYGAVGLQGDEHRVFVLDRALRIVDTAPAHRIGDVLKTLAASIAAERDVLRERHAPVLCVPRVFEVEFCRRLIAYFEETGGSESGFMIEKGGQTVGVLDNARKRRRDVLIPDGHTLRTETRLRILKRLLPVVSRAFAWQATRIERFLVGCYTARDRGYFFPHRDNTTSATAHRKFAVTINLNADAYEGGELSFPEYGPRVYKPATGDAVVFSCSLLHEARPVTSGARFAFLPFLHDDAGEQVRLANLHLLSGEPPLRR